MWWLNHEKVPEKKTFKNSHHRASKCIYMIPRWLVECGSTVVVSLTIPCTTFFVFFLYFFGFFLYFWWRWSAAASTVVAPLTIPCTTATPPTPDLLTITSPWCNLLLPTIPYYYFLFLTIPILFLTLSCYHLLHLQHLPLCAVELTKDFDQNWVYEVFKLQYASYVSFFSENLTDCFVLSCHICMLATD